MSDWLTSVKGEGGLDYCATPGQRCGRALLSLPVRSPDAAGASGPRHLQDLAGQARHAFESGDFAHAEALAREIIRLGQNLPLQLLLAHELLGTIALARGQMREGEDTLGRVVEQAAQANVSGPLSGALFAWALALYDCQDIEGLGALLEEYAALGAGECPCVYSQRAALLHALYYLAHERPVDAQHSASGGIGPSEFYTMAARLLLAECALLLKDINTAEAQIEQVDYVVVHGVARGAVLAWKQRVPQTMRHVAEMEHIHWPVQPAAVARIAQAAFTPRAAEPLALHAFGQPQLFVSGTRVDISGEPLTVLLLAYLLMNGHAADKDQIYSALWPGHESDSNLNKALAAFRRITVPLTSGPNDLIRQRDGLVQLIPAAWLDVTHFDRIYSRAHTVEGLERLTILLSAVDHYRGPFLHGYKCLWAEDQRAVYAQRQALLFYEIAALYGESGQQREAIGYLQHCINIDPLFELGIGELARLYASFGWNSQALTLLRNFRDRFKRTYKAAPAAMISHLERRVTAGPAAGTQITGAFQVAGVRGPRRGLTGPLGESEPARNSGFLLDQVKRDES